MILLLIAYLHKCVKAIISSGRVCFCFRTKSYMPKYFRQPYCLILVCAALVTGLYYILTFKNMKSFNSIYSPTPTTYFADIKTPCIGYGKSAIKYDNTCEKRFPNVLIIGVEKGGTGALVRYLSQHPQVVICEKEFKELRFFCKNYHKGFDWYKEQMPYSLPGQIVIEKSVDYFMNKHAPQRVFDFNPDIKLILAVRNPVERALSDYALEKFLFYSRNQTLQYVPQVKIGKPFPAFEEIWERYLHVLYDDGLENWLNYFDFGQIHIIETQSLVSSPVTELKDIEKFLNIDPHFDKKQFYFDKTKGFYCLRKPRFKFMTKCLPEGKGLHHPTVNTSLIQKLKDSFLPHNKRFYQLSGKQFNWDD